MTKNYIKKYLIFICILFILLTTISVVSANENTTNILENYENNDVIEVENEEPLTEDNNEILEVENKEPLTEDNNEILEQSNVNSTLKVSSPLYVGNKVVTAGESFTLNIDLTTYPSSPQNKIWDVTVKIGDHTYILTKNDFKNGVYKLTTKLSRGEYKCSARLNVDDTYEAKNFKITSYEDPKITYDFDTQALLGNSITGYVYVKSYYGYTNRGTITIDGKSYEVRGSPVYVTITPKKIGEYSFSIIYTPDTGSYINHASTYTSTITTTSPTHISVENDKTEVGYYVNYPKITVKDNLGQNIEDYGDISYYRNGVKCNTNMGLLPPQKPGVYTYKVVYTPNSKYYSSSYTYFKVTYKYKPKIIVKNINGKSHKKIKITATVKNKETGKNIKKGLMTFIINGKTYNKNIKNGKAILKIKCPKAYYWKTTYKYYSSYKVKTKYYKTVYNCKAIFHETSNYLAKSSKFKIISKKKPQMKTYKINKKKSKTKTTRNYPNAEAILKKSEYTFWFNYNGNILPNMPVTYKIYTGSTYDEYSSRTDSLGHVKICHIPKGEHTIYIEGKYLLDTYYYHSTFTVYRT